MFCSAQQWPTVKYIGCLIFHPLKLGVYLATPLTIRTATFTVAIVESPRCEKNYVQMDRTWCIAVASGGNSRSASEEARTVDADTSSYRQCFFPPAKTTDSQTKKVVKWNTWPQHKITKWSTRIIGDSTHLWRLTAVETGRNNAGWIE